MSEVSNIMNENIKFDNKNDDEELDNDEETEGVEGEDVGDEKEVEEEGEEKIDIKEEKEEIIDIAEKEEEITLKRKKPFPLCQSEDQPVDDSVWGAFKIRPTDSLDLIENEPFYRTPLVNVTENEKQYTLFVELPGLNKRNVEIMFQEGTLEIKGDKIINHKDKKKEKKEKDKEKKDKEKKEKKEEPPGEFIRREYRATSFYRSFILPEDINKETIKASFENGVLILIVPKKSAEKEEKKVIEIK